MFKKSVLLLLALLVLPTMKYQAPQVVIQAVNLLCGTNNNDDLDPVLPPPHPPTLVPGGDNGTKRT